MSESRRDQNRFVEYSFKPMVEVEDGKNLREHIKQWTQQASLSQVLKQELDQNSFFRAQWKLVKTIKKGATYKNWQLAVFMYSSEMPFYKEFHDKCRALKTISDWTLFPYKAFWMMLDEAFAMVADPNEAKLITNPCESNVFYRAIRGSDARRTFMNLNVNDHVIFQYFSPVTRNQNITKGIFSSSNGVQLQFVFTPNSGRETSPVLLARCIAEYSVYPEEGEYLLPPFQEFVVTNKEVVKGRLEVILSAPQGHKIGWCTLM